MPPTILVVGSLHYDIMVEADHLPRRDETAVGARWYPKFGGKGGNQAVAAAHAGGHARMFGATGDDDFGAFLRAKLSRAGVDTRFVETLPDTGSGMSVAILDSAGDYAATIVSGANMLIDPGQLADDEIWDNVTIVILQNEVPEAVNHAAALAARARGVSVILNAAPVRDLAPEFASLVDVLVVNTLEAEMMGAGQVDSLESASVAASLLCRSYPSVVVTAGGLGLAAATAQDDPFELPAQPVEVVSTHGAGDCFTGTLALALASGATLSDACQTGAHAAALHVSSSSA